MKTRAVAYIRVSTDDQEQHGHSPDAQLRTIKGYAQAHGVTVVRVFKETHSAYRPGRPIFDEMMAFLEERRDVDAVLVYKLDRLARNLQDFARLDDLKSTRVISATEHLSEDSSGKLLGRMMQSFAEFFSDQLSERTSLGLETKAAKGIWPSYAPTGYINDSETRTIVPDPVRAPLVVALFESCAQTGMSLQALTEWAENQGLRTRQGGALRKSAIHRLLHNSIYHGPFEWGGKVYEGTHEPLISKELFERVQDRLAERPHTFTRRSFPFRGLLTCAYCNCKITAARAKQGKYVYYRCTHGRGPCEQKYIEEGKLSEKLVSIVERVHLSTNQVSELITLIQDSQGESRRIRDQRIEALDQRLRRLEDRRNAAYEDKVDGRIGEQRWIEVDRRWSAEGLVVKQEIEELLSFDTPSEDDMRATLELLNRGPDLYRRQSHAERARLLSALVWNCHLGNESVDPVYKSPFDLIAKTASSAAWYPRQDSNLWPTV